MALTGTVSNDCNFISIDVSFDNGSVYPLVGELKFKDINGNIVGSTNVTIASQFSVTTVVVPVSSLSISYGVINIEFCYSSDVIYTYPVLIHCDIDCCLAKLTNELIDCACDCAKCSSALAKAQKIFLLIKSAEYALTQGNLLDAHNKYIKAKEICDNSCGCDC
tara:strand:+ start:1429 stop:1920 length:492 start_codon:yes stop_codon:yes gene_type:complete